VPKTPKWKVPKKVPKRVDTIGFGTYLNLKSIREKRIPSNQFQIKSRSKSEFSNQIIEKIVKIQIHQIIFKFKIKSKSNPIFFCVFAFRQRR
jgi:hypothetical protein